MFLWIRKVDKIKVSKGAPLGTSSRQIYAMQTPILAVNSLPDTTDRYFSGLSVTTRNPGLTVSKCNSLKHWKIPLENSTTYSTWPTIWIHLGSPDTTMISADVIALQCPVVARLPVTPKHQRISLTPALPSRTVSSVTEEKHQKKHDVSTTALFFRTPLLNIYVLLHYTDPTLKMSIIQQKIHLPPLQPHNNKKSPPRDTLGI